MVEHVALANRCRAEVDFPGHDYPPTVNDAHCWDLARDIGADLLGGIRGLRVAAFDGRKIIRLLLRASAGLFCWLGHAE